MERLTFSSETFDIFITQDVFEHIFNPEVAAKEIMRVLKKGGAHVFTVPKHKSLRETSARAALVNGKVTYLKEEQYHGNPVGDSKSLLLGTMGMTLSFY